MRLGEMLFDVTSTGESYAYMVVDNMIALIAEELGYAFTRDTRRNVCFASQAARASSARAKAAARAAGA